MDVLGHLLSGVVGVASFSIAAPHLPASHFMAVVSGFFSSPHPVRESNAKPSRAEKSSFVIIIISFDHLVEKYNTNQYARRKSIKIKRGGRR